ncbi:unnamed protein product [Pylaiella littoralis]
MPRFFPERLLPEGRAVPRWRDTGRERERERGLERGRERGKEPSEGREESKGSWLTRDTYSPENIFAATTTPSKRSASDTKREVVGNCIVPACNGANVSRRSPTFGGCSNFEKSGCKFKISILTAPSVCITCHGSINPGVKCLGVPHPTAERGPTGRVVYINNHLEWDQRLVARIAVRGKHVCKFVEPAEKGDERVEKPCERCSDLIAVGDFVISTYHPAPVAVGNNPTPPASNPLHAKLCARAVFDDNVNQFVDSMLFEGVPDKAVDAATLDFDF